MIAEDNVVRHFVTYTSQLEEFEKVELFFHIRIICSNLSFLTLFQRCVKYGDVIYAYINYRHNSQ